MKRTDPYTGPFPRSKHTHRCQTCLEGMNCYKKHCTKPQSVESCGWCPAWCRKPAQPVAVTAETFERQSITIRHAKGQPVQPAVKRIRCDQCEALMINGVFCHETGCPNTKARYEDGTWIKQRDCRECGSRVDIDDPCCNLPDNDWIPDYEWLGHP